MTGACLCPSETRFSLEAFINHNDRYISAFFWMLIATFCFATMAVLVKWLAPVFPQSQLIWARSAVNLAIILVPIAIFRISLKPQGRLPLLVGRGLLGIGGLTFFFYAISHLPLSVAALLNWSSPMFVLLFSKTFLGERLEREAFGWFGLAVIGLVVLMQGDQLLGRLPGVEISRAGLLTGLIGAAFAGMAYVSVRALTDKIEPLVIVFYFTVTTSILVLPLAVRGWVQPDSVEHVLGLIGVGVFAGGGQYFMTLGYRSVQAPVASTLSLMSAIFASLYGYFLFEERLSMVQWSGMILLGISVLLLVLRSQLKKAKQ